MFPISLVSAYYGRSCDLDHNFLGQLSLDFIGALRQGSEASPLLQKEHIPTRLATFLQSTGCPRNCGSRSRQAIVWFAIVGSLVLGALAFVSVLVCGYEYPYQGTTWQFVWKLSMAVATGVPIFLSVHTKDAQVTAGNKTASPQIEADETGWLRYKALFEASEQAIISQRFDGTIEAWNPAAGRIFGYKQDEAVGQPISILLPLNLRDDDQALIRQIKKTGHTERRETVWLAKNGEQMKITLTVAPIQNVDGSTASILRLAQPLLSHAEGEEQWRKTEERLTKAFRQGPLAITLTSATTERYIDVNDTFERFSGYRRDELLGRSVSEIGIWVEPEERTQIVSRMLRDGHITDIEFKYRRKSGEIRVAQASAELIEIDGERCVLGVAADITERKRAERALLESEQRFRCMANSAPVLMWIGDTHQLFTDFNREWLTFTGRKIEDEVGTGWLCGIHEEDLPAFREAYERAFGDHRDFTVEFRLRRHDGEYRWLVDHGIPRFLEDETFAGYIGCCVDVTEERIAKAERDQLSGRLIHAQEEERSRIARELHDDINQRLALLANGLLILDQDLTSSLSRPSLHELWQLTSEIAADIQLLSHQLHPSKLRDLGLAAALRSLCQDFSRQHKIGAECNAQAVPRELDESVSLCLYRVAQEALRNVAKHGKARHVHVLLAHEGHDLHLCITDDGVGFHPTQTGNSGLGLVSMRERLRLAGGKFTIHSLPGKGTRVDATLPLKLRP
jgi:PAS domain S-box-containing protein